MSKKAIIIQTDGTWMVRSWPKHPSTQADLLQEIVGGYFERVPAGKLSIWVADEGRVRGDKPNEIASGIAKQPIVGDVAITGGATPDGDVLGLTTDEFDHAIDRIAFYSSPPF